MKTLSLSDENTFVEIFKSNDLVIVGEMHGVLENAQVIQNLLEIALKTDRQIAVAFEWLLTKSDEENLQSFVTGKSSNITISKFFTDSDGRVTASHIELLKKIREYNHIFNNRITIHAFDSEQNNREETMAKKITNIASEGENLVILTTGSFHAKRFGLGSTFTSMADVLSNNLRTANFFLKYISGTVQVEDVLYDVRESEMQNDNQDDYFDYQIEIPNANPATEKLLLTKLQELTTLER